MLQEANFTNVHAADGCVDTVCKVGSFSNWEPLKYKVAFMLRYWELACFDKVYGAEVKWSFSLHS